MRGRLEDQRRCGDGTRDWSETAHAKETKWPLKERKSKETDSLLMLPERTPGFWIPGFQNCERISLHCSKPLHL